MSPNKISKLALGLVFLIATVGWFAGVNPVGIAKAAHSDEPSSRVLGEIHVGECSIYDHRLMTYLPEQDETPLLARDNVNGLGDRQVISGVPVQPQCEEVRTAVYKKKCKLIRKENPGGAGSSWVCQYEWVFSHYRYYSVCR